MDNKEVTDLSYLRELAMGDESIVIETTETFLDDAPKALARITEASAADDCDVLYQQAHKIKPSLQYMGMDKARDLIIEIEEKAKDGKISDNLEEEVAEFVQLCEQALTELSDKVEALKK